MADGGPGRPCPRGLCSGGLLGTLVPYLPCMNPTRQVPFLGHSQTSAGQRNWKGLGTLRQAYCTPQRSFQQGGGAYAAIVSLPTRIW